MKLSSSLAKLSAVAVTLALPAIDAFAIRPLNSLLSRSSPLIKRDIYEMPEVTISGLAWNSSSTPSFDTASQTVSVDGDLNIEFNFTSTDDTTVYDSINVQGYYVYGGSNGSDAENRTQIACGSVQGPISVNSSQPFQVPVTLQVTNVTLDHPILVDISTLCLGSQGGVLNTVWGGYLTASVQNETYRCPLDKTNLTIPCPAPTLGASPGSGGNATCSFIPEDPLPPASGNSTSSAPSSTSSSSSTEPASSSTDSSSSTSSTEPASSSTDSSTTPPPSSSTDSSTSASSTDSTTVVGGTTTDITTPTPSSTPVDSTVTPTEATTVSPGVTIATPTPTTTNGTTISQIPVIVTVTETATAVRRRRF